jgi:hypothetical protein
MPGEREGPYRDASNAYTRALAQIERLARHYMPTFVFSRDALPSAPGLRLIRGGRPPGDTT